MDLDKIRSLDLATIYEPGGPLLFRSGSGSWFTGMKIEGVSCLTTGLPAHPNIWPDDINQIIESGEIRISLPTPDRGHWPLYHPAFWGLRALKDLGPELESNLLAALLADYPRIRTEYDFLPTEEFPELLPQVSTADELRPLIRLATASMMPMQTITPYIGWDFVCSWDEEHGWGAITHGSEVIATGTGDLASDAYVAEQHEAALIAGLQAKN